MSSISGLSSSYLQSIVSSALQSAATTNKTNNSLSGALASSSVYASDNSQLSPFAKLMSALQQLQQSDPAKYRQVAQQIATNLKSAAKTAESDGNAKLATQLNQLSTDFTNASTSGQLPNIQDLAQAIGGHHHHRHAHSAPVDSDSGSTAGSSSNSADPTANQSQSNALDPMSIILDTLSKAGISGS